MYVVASHTKINCYGVIIMLGILILAVLFGILYFAGVYLNWKDKNDQKKRKEQRSKEREAFIHHLRGDEAPACWRAMEYPEWRKDGIYLSIADQNLWDHFEQMIVDMDTDVAIAYSCINPDGTMKLHFYTIPYDNLPVEIQKRYQIMFAQKFPDHDVKDPIRANLYKRLSDAERRGKEDTRQRIDAALAETTRYAYQNLPKCPNCHSTNIAPIGTMRRIASVELMGLASPTIGKSYECNSCGYKW